MRQSLYASAPTHQHALLHPWPTVLPANVPAAKGAHSHLLLAVPTPASSLLLLTTIATWAAAPPRPPATLASISPPWATETILLSRKDPRFQMYHSDSTSPKQLRMHLLRSAKQYNVLPWCKRVEKNARDGSPTRQFTVTPPMFRRYLFPSPNYRRFSTNLFPRLVRSDFFRGGGWSDCRITYNTPQLMDHICQHIFTARRYSYLECLEI